VRMHTIFYSFICLALALKVQAANFICRRNWKYESFLHLVDSGPYFGLEQRNYDNVPPAFYQENPQVKVFYFANHYLATEFKLNGREGMVTYTSVGLEIPVVLTTEMWFLLCKAPVSQYNCESLTLSGEFLKIEKRKYKITEEKVSTLLKGKSVKSKSGATTQVVTLLNRKSEKLKFWNTTRFSKNKSDRGFYFVSSGESSVEPSDDYLWGKQTYMTAVFYRSASASARSYSFENPVYPHVHYPGNPNGENTDNPFLLFTDEMANETCRMVDVWRPL